MQWLWDNAALVFGLAFEHAKLSIIPIVVGFVVSIPLGWLANRYRIARVILLTAGGILFTIPSLALFTVLPVILGTKILDPTNIVVALTIYAVAIMVRGAADAFSSVSKDVTQSASAVGFSPFARFWRVEFPLAGPVLVANLRVISVSTVSLLSVGAIIGVGGLGYLFINGYQRAFPEEILIGIIFVLLIAVVFDLVFVALGRLFLPWAHAPGQMHRSREAVRMGEAA